jgi:hypothetical protein
VTRAEHVLKIETEAGGKSYQKEIPFTGALLGPKGIEKASRENLKKEGSMILYRIFAPPRDALRPLRLSPFLFRADIRNPFAPSLFASLPDWDPACASRSTTDDRMGLPVCRSDRPKTYRRSAL